LSMDRKTIFNPPPPSRRPTVIDHGDLVVPTTTFP
jgi:hypothetical protein